MLKRFIYYLFALSLYSQNAFCYFAYVVSSSDSNDVSVIDSSTQEVVSHFSLESALSHYPVASPDGNSAYVVNSKPWGTSSLSFIDTATHTIVGNVALQQVAMNPAVTPSGAYVYVPNNGSNTVSIIDVATKSVVTTVEVGTAPGSIAITPDGAFAYVVNYVSNTVSVINTDSRELVATIGVGSNPNSAVASADSQYVYVSNNGTNTVSVIETASQSVVATISVEAGPSALALHPTEDILYVEYNSGDAGIAAINTSTREMVGKVSGLPYLSGMTITPNGDYAYVSIEAPSKQPVFAINLNSMEIAKEIPLEVQPCNPVVSPDGQLVYVSNSGSHTVSVIDIETSAVIDTINVTGYPVFIVFASQ